MTNRRAAEALALQAFDALREPQRKAISGARETDTGPRIQVSTRAAVRRALEHAELLEPSSREFTPWGLFVLRSVQARRRNQARRSKVSRAWSHKSN